MIWMPFLSVVFPLSFSFFVTGFQLCLVHGNETRKSRSDRAAAMRRLRALEELGHALGIMHGPRMPGKMPI